MPAVYLDKVLIRMDNRVSGQQKQMRHEPEMRLFSFKPEQCIEQKVVVLCERNPTLYRAPIDAGSSDLTGLRRRGQRKNHLFCWLQTVNMLV